MNVAQQSDEGGFSVQANRASCVFVRQKVFCPTKTTSPAKSRENPLQSRGFRKRKKYKPKISCTWRKKLEQEQAGSPKAIRQTANTVSA
ncbi:hypothetical protein DWW53_18530 [Phocaeicola vulgatus]|uniref:Uncharacterized protein n=1 Tax=Bacteroides stercoris TaxID=46506 RepID=A0A413ZR61_BACSE|nr:hypothetical protein DWW56_18885 [Phocaeicola vulgatus]RHC29384.1 hypothetical protein DW853_09250 [Bacteroides stercoris]RJV41175.1 hypothetical protein DWY55_04820 [Bacteroides sp. AF25-38AC]RJV52742.1 hypothetical protein DWW72_19780 [Bacteroides sp. AF16-7]RJV66476.1 hypothetical protein DWW30_19395 [Bacteroides sp. AF15-14LB]